MILTNELLGKIAAKRMSQQELAKRLEMTPKTFYIKMKKGVFGSDEIEKMVEILDIESPWEIFFAPNVALKVTNSDKAS